MFVHNCSGRERERERERAVTSEHWISREREARWVGLGQGRLGGRALWLGMLGGRAPRLGDRNRARVREKKEMCIVRYDPV